MKVVVDTNILFAALLKKNSWIAELLTFESDYAFFTPRFAIVELFHYKERILSFSQLSEEELLELFHLLLKRVHLYDEDQITLSTWRKAWELVREVDEKDLPFIALVLELEALLWTKDEHLMKGLSSQGFHNFFVPGRKT